VTDGFLQRLSRLASYLIALGLVVAAGSAVAAWNWHGIWTSLSTEDPASRLALEALGRSGYWTLVCLTTLVVVAIGTAYKAWVPHLIETVTGERR
jgi:hypothetical protein